MPRSPTSLPTPRLGCANVPRGTSRAGTATLVGALLLLLGSGACSNADSPDERPSGSVSPTKAAPQAAAPKRAPARRAEQPLPAFRGTTLEGERVKVGDFLGQRLLLFFFNPEVASADSSAEALVGLQSQRAKQNFEILGIATASSPTAAQNFAARHGIEFPIIDDSEGSILRRFGLRAPVTLIGVDGDGYVIFGIGDPGPGSPEAVATVAAQVRERLRIPREEALDEDTLRPTAPDFTAPVMGSETPFTLAEHRGKPVLLIFFLHTCPHCHEVLAFLREELDKMPAESRPELVGLEITGKTHSVRARMIQHDIDFFPVLFDPDGSIQQAYGVFAGVPDLLMIDSEGRIADRVQGWSEDIEPLTRMRLARLAGQPVPMLLSQQGYSGSEVCGVCHPREFETWNMTSHARAFDTLVRHDASTDSECVGCHVVGFEKTGGFEISPPTRWLENVGCESCHGRGGVHLSPDFAPAGNYESACISCHDTKHSLGFEYASFLPQVSHAANAALLDLPAADRERILAERGARREELLPSSASYVGSQICQDCHTAEFETWAANPHARAVETLVAEGQESNAECLACHTTGSDKPGGFPLSQPVTAHPDLARVGCEACHGPGGNHVAEGATKAGSILALADKCDSCVILQICGRCHDDANDPGFEFEVQDKIDRIRHASSPAKAARAPHGLEERIHPGRTRPGFFAHAGEVGLPASLRHAGAAER